MHENMIHLVFTPHQANALAVAVKIAKEMMASVPNTPVYPATLGELERELIRAEIGATQEALLEQLEEQMPEHDA